jgi:hypothetical protein
MAERAGLFEETEDFDVSAFAPKTIAKAAEPASEEVRAVSEAANFQSREPVKEGAAKTPAKSQQRRRRTGRNEQLNIKVAKTPRESFYEIADRHAWGLGETFERAIEALQRELAGQR